MLSFAYPTVLVLLVIPLAVAVITYRRRADSSSPARSVIVACLQFVGLASALIALAQPVLAWPKPERVQVTIVDLSNAMPDDRISAAADELARGRGEARRMVAFANRAAVVDQASNLTDGTSRETLRRELAAPQQAGDPIGGAVIADALQLAGALVPQNGAGEVRLVSPGVQTRGDAAAELARLAARGIAVTIDPTTPEPRAPFVLNAPTMPPSTAIGETVLLNASAVARTPLQAMAEVFLNGERVAGPMVLDVGTTATALAIPVPLRQAGHASVELRVTAGGVERRGETSSWVADSRHVVVIEGADRALSTAIALGRLLGPSASVVGLEPQALHDPSLIASADLIVVGDVAASDFDEATQVLIRSRVDAGAGLLFTGGTNSFGPGGWATSSLADLMPVKMPQELERPDPSASVVFIIDTSGSMGTTRLELAKEVARLAMRRLEPQDKAGIVEFYGAKRWAAPLQSATNRLDLFRALNRLTSGGGTEIYPALEEASYALRNVNTRTKHVIILTDGGVESAAFDKLIRKMADDGQTVSTVIIGGDESPLMESMAEWGNGRCYRVTGRLGIPEILLHQPSTDTPPPTVETPTRVVPRERDAVTSAIDWSKAPPLNGYVRVTAKPTADLLLASEVGDALLARWRFGRGRVAALPTQLGSAWTSEFGHWDGTSTLVSNLCRSLYGLPAGGSLAINATARPAGLEVQADALIPDLAGALSPLTLEVFDTGRRVAAVTVDPLRANSWNALLPAIAPGNYELRLHTVEGTLKGKAAVVVPAARIDQGFGPNEAFLLQAKHYAAIAEAVAAKMPATGASAYVGLRGPFILLSMIALLLNLYVRRRATSARPRVLWAALAAICSFLNVPAASAQAPTTAATQPTTIYSVRDDIATLAERASRATASPAATARDWADLATAQEVAGDAAACASSLRRAVELEPDAAARDLLRVRLTVLLNDIGDVDAAWDVMKARASERPRKSSVLFLGSLLGRPELVKAVPTTSPTEPPSLFQELLEGSALLETGDAASAQARFAAALPLATEGRDRRFVTERTVAAARAAGTLPTLVDGWLREPSPSAERLLLLATVLRDLGRVDDLLALLRRTEIAALGGEDAGAAFIAEVIGSAEEAGRSAEVESICRERWSRDPANLTWLKSMVGVLLNADRATDADGALDRAAAEAKSASSLMRIAKLAQAAGRDDAAIGAAARSDKFAVADRVAGALFVAALERDRGRIAASDEQLSAALRLAGSDGRQLRAVADANEQVGATDKAIEIYRTIAATNEGARPRLAWLLKNAGKLDEAQAIWAALAASAPSESRRVEAQGRMLELASSTGSIGDIAAALEDRVAERRATADDIAQLVRIYVRIDDPFSAADALRNATDVLGGETEMLRQLADLYLQCGQFGLADRTLRTLVDRDPDHAVDTLQRLATLAIERKRPDDARAALNEVARRTASDASTAVLSAGVYGQLGMHAEAAAAYERALAEQPDQAENWILWANAMKGAKQQPAAVRRLLLLAVQANTDEVFAVAIDGLLNLDAPREVLRVARRAAILHLSQNPRRLTNYELVRELSQSVGDAATTARAGEFSLLVAGEQRTVLLREMINVAASSKQAERSLAYQRTLLALGDQVPPQVFLDIGSQLLAGGQTREAERAFRRAVEVSDDENTRLQVARVYEKAGQLRVALRTLDPVVSRRPNDIELRMRVASLNELSGDTSAAITQFAEAIALLERKGNIAAGLETARSFDAGISKSVSDAERYLDGLLRGLVNVARSPAEQERAANFARKLVAERIAHDTSRDSVPGEVADVVRLLRRVAFAVHRPDVADAADREVIARHAGDREFAAGAIADRRTWGLSARADAFARDFGALPDPSTQPISASALSPDDVAERVPPLILSGKLEEAKRLFAAARKVSPSKGEAFPMLVAAALALDDSAAARAWSHLWLNGAANGARGEPDPVAVRTCIRGTWLAVGIDDRRAMTLQLRDMALRSTGSARQQLALLAVQASLALDEDAASRVALAANAAGAADLSADTLATLVRAVPEADRAGLVEAAGQSWLPAKRRAMLLQFANANDVPLGPSGTDVLARAISVPVPARSGTEEEAGPRFVPVSSTKRPEIWRAIAESVAPRATSTPDEAILAAQAFSLAGDEGDADRAASGAILAIVREEGDPKLPELIAAARALTPPGAAKMLASIDVPPKLDAANKLLLAAVLNERLGHWDRSLSLYAEAFAARPENKSIRSQLVTSLRTDQRWSQLVSVFRPFAKDPAVVDNFVKSNVNSARSELAWTPGTDISVFSIYSALANETGSLSEREQRRFRAFHQLLRQRREFVIYPARAPVRAGGLQEFDSVAAGRPTVYQSLSSEPWAGEESLAALRATPPGAPEADGIVAGFATMPASQRQAAIDGLEKASRADAMTTNDRTLMLALLRSGAARAPWMTGELECMADTANPSDLRRLREIASVLDGHGRRTDITRWLAAASRVLRDGTTPAMGYTGAPLATAGTDVTSTEAADSAFLPPGTEWDDEAESARLTRIAVTHPDVARAACVDAERRNLFNPNGDLRTSLFAARMAIEAGDDAGFSGRLMRAIDASLSRSYQRIPDIRLALPSERATVPIQRAAVQAALAAMTLRAEADPADARDMTRLVSVLGRWAIERKLDAEAEACTQTAVRLVSDVGEHVLWASDLLRLAGKRAEADEMLLRLLRAGALPPIRIPPLIESIRSTDPAGAVEVRRLAAELAAAASDPTTRPAASTRP